jgi:hypothetical protein
LKAVRRLIPPALAAVWTAFNADLVAGRTVRGAA